MQKLNLLVDDDFIEEFVKSLPKEKVIVIEENFQENQKLLDDVLTMYEQESEKFIPYYESMKNISSWFKEKEIK